MNRTELNRLFYRTDLSTDLNIIESYVQIIDDYLIDRSFVFSLLKKADKKKKKEKHFNEYSYIVYELVSYGKEKSFKRKEHKNEDRQNHKTNQRN